MWTSEVGVPDLVTDGAACNIFSNVTSTRITTLRNFRAIQNNHTWICKRLYTLFLLQEEWTRFPTFVHNKYLHLILKQDFFSLMNIINCPWHWQRIAWWIQCTLSLLFCFVKCRCPTSHPQCHLHLTLCNHHPLMASPLFLEGLCLLCFGKYYKCPTAISKRDGKDPHTIITLSKVVTILSSDIHPLYWRLL